MKHIKTILIIAMAFSFFSCEKTEDTTLRDFEHYVGEPYGGGVIFHVYYGTDEKEHGLIVALTDQSTAASWGLESTLVPECESTWNGKANTESIIALSPSSNTASALCDNFSFEGKIDWYLPSVDELNLLYTNKFIVNQMLSRIEEAQEISQNEYWSSTQATETMAWSTNNNQVLKTETLHVRAIRRY